MGKEKIIKILANIMSYICVGLISITIIGLIVKLCIIIWTTFIF